MNAIREPVVSGNDVLALSERPVLRELVRPPEPCESERLNRLEGHRVAEQGRKRLLALLGGFVAILAVVAWPTIDGLLRMVPPLWGLK